MDRVNSIKELRQRVAAWRAAGDRIALVPTMGNLHAGHLELVKQAQQRADRVVVTIFVNPMQFSAGEDFGSYPRTLEQDIAQLDTIDTDLLFSPPVEEVYPRGQAEQTTVTVPSLSDILCGASRPGHFAGVATVVCKLFNMVQPDVALFGTKDFQQLLVIRRMVEDLCIPIEIVGVPTVRESDGLARSSRNGYLTADERAIAPVLYRVMCETATAIAEGRSNYTMLELEAKQALEAAGFKPDYYSIRNVDDLADPENGEKKWVILAAAYLGKARLIDNIVLQIFQTIVHFFPELFDKMREIYNSRKKSDYQLVELIMAGIAMFIFKEGSRNAFNNDRKEGKFKTNYEKVFKMKMPHMDTVDNIMRKLAENELEELKKSMIRTKLPKKALHKFRFLGKWFLVAVDATGVASFDEKHCENCSSY